MPALWGYLRDLFQTPGSASLAGEDFGLVPDGTVPPRLTAAKIP